MYYYTFNPKDDITLAELTTIVSVLFRAVNRIRDTPELTLADERQCENVDRWLGSALRHFAVDKV
jgi:hypothetical protein